MNQWDLSPFSVTPAASLLSKCVSKGILTQEQIDSASSCLSPAFSADLQEAEQRIRTQRKLDELNLELELLQMDKENSDVTHTFHLSVRANKLQSFCCHLQHLLKEKNGFTHRLMKPLTHTHLPVPAHLHRYVVVAVAMLRDFIQTLEDKLKSLQCVSTATIHLETMNASLVQLLSHASHVEGSANQVLRWKDVNSTISNSASGSGSISISSSTDPSTNNASISN